MEKKLLEFFKKNNRKKQMKKEFSTEKVIKKGDKYVKQKGYSNSFNSWIT